MSAAPATIRETVETIRVGASAIVLRRVAPTMTGPDQGALRPAEKSRYAVEVDGILRGHIAYPYGFDAVWEAYSLGRCTPGRPGPVRLLGPLSPDGCFVRRDRRELARLFPDWIARGLAPTEAEIADHAAAESEARTLREAEAARERAAEAADRERLRAQASAARAVRESEQAERLATLRRLRDREPGSLTNAEIDALEWAIDSLVAHTPR